MIVPSNLQSSVESSTIATERREHAFGTESLTNLSVDLTELCISDLIPPNN